MIIKAFVDGSLLYSTNYLDPNSKLLEAKVKCEFGTSGSFSFRMPPTHPLYNLVHCLRSFVEVYIDDELIFFGRPLTIQDSTNLDRSVDCEGALAYLNDSIVPPDRTRATDPNISPYVPSAPGDVLPTDETYNQANIPQSTGVTRTNEEHFRYLIDCHNAMVSSDRQFTVGRVENAYASDSQEFDASGWRTTKQAIDSDLLSYCGGYLRCRRVNNTNYIDWIQDINEISVEPIRMGYNLMDLSIEHSGSDKFSVLVPIGDDDLTIEEVNDGDIGIYDDDAVSEYGGFIYHVETFSGIKDPTRLMQLGQAWMNMNYHPNSRSFQVTALEMKLLDGDITRIREGTKVTVISEPHGVYVDSYDDLIVRSVEYDLITFDRTVFEIGDPRETLSQRWVKDSDQTSQQLANNAFDQQTAASASSALQSALNDNAATTKTQGQKVSSLEGDMVTVKGKTVDIEAKLVDIDADILDIRTQKLEIDTEIADIKAKQINVDTEIADIKAEQINIDTDIYNLQTESYNLQTKTATIESNLTNLTTDVLNIDSRVNTLNSEITSVYGSLGTENLVVSQSFSLCGQVSGSADGDYVQIPRGVWTFNGMLVAENNIPWDKCPYYGSGSSSSGGGSNHGGGGGGGDELIQE